MRGALNNTLDLPALSDSSTASTQGQSVQFASLVFIGPDLGQKGQFEGLGISLLGG